MLVGSLMTNGYHDLQVANETEGDRSPLAVIYCTSHQRWLVLLPGRQSLDEKRSTLLQ